MSLFSNQRLVPCQKFLNVLSEITGESVKIGERLEVSKKVIPEGLSFHLPACPYCGEAQRMKKAHFSLKVNSRSREERRIELLHCDLCEEKLVPIKKDSPLYTTLIIQEKMENCHF